MLQRSPVPIDIMVGAGDLVVYVTVTLTIF